MKLWLLHPVDAGGDHWDPRYGRTYGFVVRAETEDNARTLAQADDASTQAPTWTDESLTMCVELTADVGDPGVVLEDNFGG